MRKNVLIGQLLAFLAAGVVVLTAMYVAILWRNQSPTRVMQMGSGKLVYQTPDMALGVTKRGNGPDQVTLLRFTQDGGWVITGTGSWLNNAKLGREASIALIENPSAGPMSVFWLCVVRHDASLSRIELENLSNPDRSATFDFHNGGIIEPIVEGSRFLIRGYAGDKPVFSIHWSPNND